MPYGRTPENPPPAEATPTALATTPILLGAMMTAAMLADGGPILLGGAAALLCFYLTRHAALRRPGLMYGTRPVVRAMSLDSAHDATHGLAVQRPRAAVAVEEDVR